MLEYQTYERVAPVIASKFLEANTPVIAIEIPHPGATYFGANNYKAGLIGGKGIPPEVLRDSRGWSEEDWETATAPIKRRFRRCAGDNRRARL